MKKIIKCSILVCLSLMLTLVALNVSASEDVNNISILQKSFADESQTAQLSEQIVDANLAWDISFDKTEINVGDTVTATIAIKNNGVADFTDGGGIQFEIHYDEDMFEPLILDEISTCDDISGVIKDESDSGVFYIYRFGNRFTISSGASVLLATVELTAKSNIVGMEESNVTADKLNIASALLTSYDAKTLYLDSETYEAEDSIAIYDIKVSFKPGDFGSITGQDVAYARYNETGLFNDATYATAFSLPEITANERQAGDTFGYRVSNKGWLYNSDDKFTQNQVLTAQYTKTQNIIFYNSNGAGDEKLVVTDNGANVAVPQTATGFAGWFDASIAKFTGKQSELIVNVPVATADVAYRAYFYANSKLWIAETFATVTPISGVATDKKVTGDIKFTVDVPLWANLKSVKAFCGENEVSIAHENEEYVILNSHLNGDVTVKVVTEVKGTVAVNIVRINAENTYSVYRFTPDFENANTGYYKLGELKYAKHSNGEYLAIDEGNSFTDSDVIREKMSFSEGSEIVVPESGDLDSSGGTDIRDVQEIFTYYTDGVALGTDAEKAKKWFAADLNNDLRIDVSDAQLAVIEMLK